MTIVYSSFIVLFKQFFFTFLKYISFKCFPSIF